MARKLDPERTLPTGIDSGLGVMPTVVWIASLAQTGITAAAQQSAART
jgi:hypothetical protein